MRQASRRQSISRADKDSETPPKVRSQTKYLANNKNIFGEDLDKLAQALWLLLHSLWFFEMHYSGVPNPLAYYTGNMASFLWLPWDGPSYDRTDQYNLSAYIWLGVSVSTPISFLRKPLWQQFGCGMIHEYSKITSITLLIFFSILGHFTIQPPVSGYVGSKAWASFPAIVLKLDQPLVGHYNKVSPSITPTQLTFRPSWNPVNFYYTKFQDLDPNVLWFHLYLPIQIGK